MIGKSTKFRRLLLQAIAALSAMLTYAETASSGKVTIQYEPTADGGIRVINVWNKSDKRIYLMADGKSITVNANSSAQPNQYARRVVRFDYATSSGALLWRYAEPAKKEPAQEKDSRTEKQPASATPAAAAAAAQPVKTPRPQEAKREEPAKSALQAEPQPRREPRQSVDDILKRLNQDPYFGQEAVNGYLQSANRLSDGLEASKDKHQFIIDHEVMAFLSQSVSEMETKKTEIPSIAQNLVVKAKFDASNQSSTVGWIVETLTNRLRTREEAYEKLKELVDSCQPTEDTSDSAMKEKLINYGIVGLILLAILFLAVMTIRKKGKKNTSSKGTSLSAKNSIQAADSNPAIVVRRRTTSILKKQSLDDVVGNPSYLVIDSRDFTPDSAVEKIYIKNSCIKEIYNLYAEDLRNSDKPKEDGCMVLGRWLHNEADDTYDVSLEEVVFPGDDAVFKEYELNFGGKIKLRIAEKLRKLRRDTNLQYDLVCWVHSHPGLGVFFSNSDVNVQMQLKHAQHPNFLIAFVVDILTSSQEMGIFTFRRDGSVTSKGDLTKMYSLEELYKWALQTDRQTFSHENYFDVLKNAEIKTAGCRGIEMNNSSIIDLTQIVVEPVTGIVGWAIGTTVENKDGQEYVVIRIVKNAEKPQAGIIGCLVSVPHMSLPTIQRLIASECINLSFVMVYSSRQMSLTTIPVINGVLLPDERAYGDVNIDDLKIWTRRKR